MSREFEVVGVEEIGQWATAAAGGWLVPLLVVCGSLLLCGVIVGLLLADLGQMEAEEPDEQEPDGAVEMSIGHQLLGAVNRLNEKLERPTNVTPLRPEGGREAAGEGAAHES